VATGSPSPDIERPEGTRRIAQANNVFIFPGVGLAAIVAEARELTDDVFLAAARELASLVSAERLACGAIYPPINELRSVTRRIAIAVVRSLRDAGTGRRWPDDEIERAVDQAIWRPEYLEYVPD
jgi:malic enzyme